MKTQSKIALKTKHEERLKKLSHNITSMEEQLRLVKLEEENVRFRLDTINLDLTSGLSYSEVINEENFMRENMYKPEFQDHPMNTDPWYNLIKITPEIWEKMVFGTSIGRDILFSPYHPPPDVRYDEKWCREMYRYTSDREYETYLSDAKKRTFPVLKRTRDITTVKQSILNSRFKMEPKTIIAGGKVFGSLFDTKSNDVDVFLYSQSPEEAKKTIDKMTREQNMIKRTKNCISFGRSKEEIQVILRLYKSVSEILHGFDVDSCCMGFDGTNIWMTKRCLFSLTHGYNTVNFDRLSPSYEHRLVKYALRGMPVKVPGFDRRYVHLERLEDFYRDLDVKRYRTNKFRGYAHLKGLDILLGTEYKLIRNNFSEMTIKSLNNLTKLVSDYTPVAVKHDGSFVSDIFDYLKQTADKYPEFSTEYMPLIHKLSEDDSICERLSTNSFLRANKVSFIAGPFDKIWDINPILYKFLEIFRPCDFPQMVEFKVTNPGEQMTNTFNQIVLDNPNVWYKGDFYNPPGSPFTSVIEEIKELLPGHVHPNFKGGEIFRGAEEHFTGLINPRP